MSVKWTKSLNKIESGDFKIFKRARDKVIKKVAPKLKDHNRRVRKMKENFEIIYPELLRYLKKAIKNACKKRFSKFNAHTKCTS